MTKNFKNVYQIRLPWSFVVLLCMYGFLENSDKCAFVVEGAYFILLQIFTTLRLLKLINIIVLSFNIIVSALHKSVEFDIFSLACFI